MKLAALILGAASLCGAAEPTAPGHVLDRQAVQDVLAGRRKTADASWWGFDPVDATAALQAAIKSGARKVVVPNMGQPWIVDPLFLAGDQELVLERGVEIQARRGGFLYGNDSLLTLEDKANATITGYGASLVMHKEDYRKRPYAKAEWRHCLNLLGSTNVKISGIRCASSGGDGVYIGRTKEHSFSKDVVIKDVILEDHYRQAVSVISVDGLLIESATLRGTEGTAPRAGIDFEPNHRDERLVGITLKDCVIEKNAGYGILVASMNLRDDTPPVDIVVEGGRVEGNGEGALMVVSEKAKGRVAIHAAVFQGARALTRVGALRLELGSEEKRR